MDDHPDFLAARRQRIADYAQNQKLLTAADTFLVESIDASYSYNFDWLGLPIIQYPQDLVVLQELIWRIRPDCIIETGVARGGSLVFYASMLELLGQKGKVIGIDIDIREHNKKRILEHPLARRIQMVEGSSIDAETLEQVRGLVGNAQKIMVCLDSNHTHEHVLKELELYAPFVSPGSYCVVFDTIIEMMPSGYYQDRPWNKGNSPDSAIQTYLQALNASDARGVDQAPLSFEIDQAIDAQMLVSVCRGGYLRRRSVSSPEMPE